MNSCLHCANAEWQRTSAGKMHPSGDGKCRKAIEWKAPPIPACSYWLGISPTPNGHTINRRKTLPDHCAYWTRKQA